MKSKTITAIAAFGLTTVGLVVVAEPSGAKPNASPHFLPTSFQVNVNGATADARIRYTAAGFGNGGKVWIKVRGEVTFHSHCEKHNGEWYDNFVYHDVRVNEHEATADQFGNFFGDDYLRPNAVCPGGAISYTMVSDPVWDHIEAHMYDYKTRKIEYDAWYDTTPVGPTSW